MISEKIVFSFHNVSNQYNLGFNNISKDKFLIVLKNLKYFSENNNIELCFDDAYESIINNALAIVDSFDFKKTIFPVTEYIGDYNNGDVNFFINKKKHASYSQLEMLSKNSWMIGSHGHNHIGYNTLNNEEIYSDMRKSKEKLEDILNLEVTSFTPPFGYFNISHLPILDKSGYKNIYLNKCYINEELFDSELNFIIRYPIYSIDNFHSIKRKINKNTYQEKVDQLIHLCSRATIFVKKMY